MSGWKFSPDVIDKARAYLEEDRLGRDPEVEGIYWVRGSREGRPYRVQTDASAETGKATWINCTCPFGLQQGSGTATCSHAAAVLLAVRQQRKEMTT